MDAFEPRKPATPVVEECPDLRAHSLNLAASAISAIPDLEPNILSARLLRGVADRMATRMRFTNPPRYACHRPMPHARPPAIDNDAATTGTALMPMRSGFFD